MNRTARGFTLIEVLVAIAIFSVMSVFAYQGLRGFLRARDVTTAQTAEFARLVTGVTVLQQDFEEAVPRPVRDALGDDVPALRSGQARGEVVAFTRHTAWTAATPGESDLRRIEYRVADGELVRRTWSALDRVAATGFTDRTVLEGVADITLRYYGDGAWQESWPMGEGLEALTDLPQAVAITLQFTNGRSLERRVRLAGGGS